jgi:hypothetical protein
MRIYIFKSEANDSLCAFAGDAEGSKLPAQFAPWHSEGVIEASRAPPHGFSRIRIEGAIRVSGFQLWRMKQPVAVDGSSAQQGSGRERIAKVLARRSEHDADRTAWKSH